jgi:hypothetical protein
MWGYVLNFYLDWSKTNRKVWEKCSLRMKNNKITWFILYLQFTILQLMQIMNKIKINLKII